MTDTTERQEKKTGQVSRPKRLELKKTVEKGQVKQSFSHGRSKMVTVEVRKKRTYAADSRGRLSEVGHGAEAERSERPAAVEAKSAGRRSQSHEQTPAKLTSHELAVRARVLKDALKTEEEQRAAAKELEAAMAAEALAAEEAAAVARLLEEGDQAGESSASTVHPAEADEPEGASAEAVEARPADGAPAPESPDASVPKADAERPTSEPAEAAETAPEEQKPEAEAAPPSAPAPEKAGQATEAERAKVGQSAQPPKGKSGAHEAEDTEEKGRTRRAAKPERRTPAAGRRDDANRRSGKLSVSAALDGGESERVRSLASVRRAREKERQKHLQALRNESQKVIREVVIPETISVQELANRMAERGGAVVKALMKMGVMVTINQNIDADTAEVIVGEFGHKAKRVSEADVEIGLKGDDDADAALQSRPPVVTIMGHVDHGKTSLLDALRKTDVAAREAGGITQHIGAYQVTLPGGDKITFIDTPGHAAFTDMRARGAKVTDVVVLVVAADDGVMPQTVEAIAHARAAGVPMIVAVNKVDIPGADPQRIRTNLLQHNVVVEDMGGETLVVDVSAKTGEGLDKLAEAIVLQSEILDLKANPDRPAEGVIVESKIERGRGSVATVLVQRGTLRVGDIFVAGAEWGRVRSLMDATGASLEAAVPGQPAEVLGLNGTPAAGDDVVVVDSEARAREVTEFRQRRDRDAKAAPKRGSLQQMFDQISQGEIKELPLVIKADVHGSVEAIAGALEKLGGDEVKVTILHSGVGGINESDVTLARASDALVIGFNVRANPQAREQAKRDGVEIRYFSIIYDLIDNIGQTLTGMMAPTYSEKLLGYAEIREVFNITKVGKVAGCMVTEGLVRRGGRVRLLRDNVVIHQGELGQLKRFKDDVKEVKEGYDCGITLANYQDIQVGDLIECFEMEQNAPAG